MDDENVVVVKLLGERHANWSFKCNKCHQTVPLKAVRVVCRNGRCRYWHNADGGVCQPIDKSSALTIDFQGVE